MHALRAVGRLVRAVLLLAALAAAVVGLPYALWHFFGQPLPGHIPGYGEIKTWLDQATASPDETAIQILVVAAWGYWAIFALQIAVQLPGVTGDTVRAFRSRTPLPSSVHANLAGRLLSTVAISIIATRSGFTTASAATTTSGGPPPMSVTVATTHGNSTVHVVRAGQSLWGIAAARLGDSERWKEIYELNRYRVQFDGHLLTDPDVIRPGWVLTLPERITGLGAKSELASPDRASPPLPSQQSPRNQSPTLNAVPQLAPQTALPTASSPTVSQPLMEDQHQAPSAVRRPVAVALPTGGYVSLALGAGLAAALAAASVRSRVNAHRRVAGERYPVGERLREPEATLLKAAVLLGHGRDDSVDPYVDSWSDPTALTIPGALTALRAPIAVYIGDRRGRPVPLATVAVGGLGLIGDGAQDTARAVLISALAAGGFLADAAVYTIVTTTDDLLALTGHRRSGRIMDRLIVCDTFAEAFTALSDTAVMTKKPLLLATADSAAALTASTAVDLECVLIGCSDVATVADIGTGGTITATGPAASVLDATQAYRLGLDEARALFGRLLAAAPPARPASPVDQEAPRGHPPAAATAVEVEPSGPAAVVPVPRSASGVGPTASEAALTVNILGPLQVLRSGRDVTEHFRPMTAAVLIQLALNPRGITRTALAADLWSAFDLDPDARARRFKATLSHTRLALAHAHGDRADHIVEARPARILTLNSDLVDVDFWRFGLLLDEAEPRAGRDPSARLAALLEAIAMHRGQIAHGQEHAGERADDEVWLAPHREAYFHRLVDAHAEAAVLMRATDPDHAIAVLERACDLEPWNNALSEQIIEILLENDQRHAAARRFAVLTEHLAYLGMKPSPRIAAMAKSLPLAGKM